MDQREMFDWISRRKTTPQISNSDLGGFCFPLSVVLNLIPCSDRNLQNDHLGNVEQTLRGRETRFQVRQKA